MQSLPQNNQGPWSVNENNELLFKGLEHKVSPSSKLKKSVKSEEIKALANMLNTDFKAGILTDKSIKVGGTFGSKLQVKANQAFTETFALAEKAKVPQEVVMLAKQLFKPGMSINVQIEICQALCKIPQETRQAAVDFTKQCLAQEKFPEMYTATILKALSTVPPELLEHLMPLLKDTPLWRMSDEIPKLSDALNNLQPAQRGTILKNAKPLMESVADAESKAEILSALAKIPKQNQAQAVKSALVLKTTFGSFDIEAILKIGMNRSPDECQDYINELLPVLKLAGQSGLAKLQIFIEGIKLPLKSIPSFINDCLPMLKESQKNNELGMTFSTLLKLPENDRSEVLDLISPTVKRFRMIDRQAFLSSVCNLSDADRLSVLRDAAPFLSKCVNFAQTEVVLGCIRLIPLPERENVINHANLLLQDNFTIQRLDQVMRALLGTHPDEREEVVAITLSMAQGVGFDPAATLSAVRSIPGDRAALLENAGFLLNYSENPEYKLGILRKLADLPTNTERRTQMLDQMRQYLATNRSEQQILRQLHQIITESNMGEFDDIPSFGNNEPYRVLIARESLKTNPLEVLNNLVEGLSKKEATQLSIEFIGEPGIDASGLGREFIALLVDNAVKALKQEPLPNGLYRGMQLTPETTKVIHQLGELMMFCMTAARDYPIGMIFDQGVFSMMSKLDRGPFEKIIETEEGFQEMLALYVQLEGANEKEQVFVKLAKAGMQPITEETDVQMLKELYDNSGAAWDDSFAEIADQIEADPAILKQHLASLQEVIRDTVMTDIVNGRLKPAWDLASELVKGMLASPHKDLVSVHAIKKGDPVEVAAKIQGQLTKELVLGKLEFQDDITVVQDGIPVIKNGIPKRKRRWFREWVKGFDEAKLKRFVFALTGSYAVGQLGLKIHTVPSNIVFHTCFASVDIPFQNINDKALFDGMMDGALVDAEKEKNTNS